MPLTYNRHCLILIKNIYGREENAVSVWNASSVGSNQGRKEI
jgi:hypothetical protein